VAGDSVGGNMATAVTLLAKERGGPNIMFQSLFYPVTDANFDTPSYRAYQDGYFLTREAMKWFWENYTSDQTNRKEPTVSPLQASTEQLRGLPPALIINGEFDVLRDEGEAYAHKLIEAGVPVTGLRYHGTIHDFVMLNPSLIPLLHGERLNKLLIY
jgi:acetyl esterase